MGSSTSFMLMFPPVHFTESREIKRSTQGSTLLSANPTKWANTQTIRSQQQQNCLSVFDHFVGLVLKVLKPVFPSYRNQSRHLTL